MVASMQTTVTPALTGATLASTDQNPFVRVKIAATGRRRCAVNWHELRSDHSLFSLCAFAKHHATYTPGRAIHGGFQQPILVLLCGAAFGGGPLKAECRGSF
jgi:hypothetical protein